VAGLARFAAGLAAALSVFSCRPIAGFCFPSDFDVGPPAAARGAADCCDLDCAEFFVAALAEADLAEALVATARAPVGGDFGFVFGAPLAFAVGAMRAVCVFVAADGALSRFGSFDACGFGGPAGGRDCAFGLSTGNGA
jgi:hypothetical protein